METVVSNVNAKAVDPIDGPYYAECEGEDLVNEYRRVRNEIRAAIEAGIANGALVAGSQECRKTQGSGGC
jgi:hypothetical protein